MKQSVDHAFRRKTIVMGLPCLPLSPPWSFWEVPSAVCTRQFRWCFAGQLWATPATVESLETRWESQVVRANVDRLHGWQRIQWVVSHRKWRWDARPMNFIKSTVFPFIYRPTIQHQCFEEMESFGPWTPNPKPYRMDLFLLALIARKLRLPSMKGFRTKSQTILVEPEPLQISELLFVFAFKGSSTWWLTHSSLNRCKSKWTKSGWCIRGSTMPHWETQLLKCAVF